MCSEWVRVRCIERAHDGRVMTSAFSSSYGFSFHVRLAARASSALFTRRSCALVSFSVATRSMVVLPMACSPSFTAARSNASGSTPSMLLADSASTTGACEWGLGAAVWLSRVLGGRA